MIKAFDYKNLIRTFFLIEPQDPMLSTHIRARRDERYKLARSPNQKCRCFVKDISDDDGRPRPYKCDK
jgi:hypothetical protein